ncbi:MAG: glycosyltransferase [Bacteroidales bacterium]|nr:glycosyltransferase [Bacteroidales bacterium]
MTQQTISVVIHSYNHGRYIEACLDSIYYQDYECIEMILVEDGSTDNSCEVIERWLKSLDSEMVSFGAYYNSETGLLERRRHKRYNREGRFIKFLNNKRNMGSTWTYNRGLRHATGKYCTFVAADDVCHPQLFSTLVRPLEEGVADFVFADMFIIDDHGRILREFRLPDYDFKSCFCDWYLCGVATLYRMELHERFGWYDETALADDHECYLRFAMGGARFFHIPKTLYSVRSHDYRKVDLHDNVRFSALIDFSKELTLKARTWMKNNVN